MSFLGHLEVLRWHLMRSVIAIFIFTIAAALLMKSYIFPEIIIAPTKLNFWTYQQLCELSNLLNTDALCIKKLGFTIQSRKLPAQFTTHIRASLVIGFIAAFPYVFWEIWRFIKPALYTKEQIMAKSTVFFVSLLFFMGVAFGYYLILPLSLNFLGNYQLDPNILNEIDLGNYISTIISIILAAGIMFQLPMLSLFFSKIGLLTPQFLMNYRKHSVVVILFISAILTPPDVASQLLLSVPLFLLYEVSIQISKYVTKNNKI
ncbi:MAG: twin-arginine translocase subunit TatC [Cytophagales bacterium]|nr:twin-arginine translocase subunit TatC [Cytophagales bacterium]